MYEKHYERLRLALPFPDPLVGPKVTWVTS